MEINWIILLLAALVPMVIGFLWYNPKTFGTAWMKATGMTEEKAKGANMGVIFALTFLFSFFIAFALQSIVIHQYGMFATLVNEPGFNEAGSEVSNYFNDFMAKYGNNFRTFKHGMLHGTLTGIMIALPVIAINAMFERKGFRYIAINAVFFIVCMMLMGGILCQWG